MSQTFILRYGYIFLLYKMDLYTRYLCFHKTYQTKDLFYPGLYRGQYKYAIINPQSRL